MNKVYDGFHKVMTEKAKKEGLKIAKETFNLPTAKANRARFEPDLILDKDWLADIEVRNSWKESAHFPFATVNIPYRKRRWLWHPKLSFFIFNAKLDRCLMIGKEALQQCPVEALGNQHSERELFWVVPITDFSTLEKVKVGRKFVWK